MLRTSVVTAALGACLVIAGCGGGENCGGGDESAAEGKAPIRAAYASALDPNDMADQFGLEDAGAKVQTLGDDSAVVAGLLRGDIDVGNVDFDAAMKAATAGVPLKVIYISQAKPEYVFVSRPEIPSLDDLGGKKVGYHAKGSQTEIFARALIKQKAPDVYDDVDFLGLEESSRRAQALVAGRMDATAVEAINLAQLKQEGDYHQLGTWGDLGGQAGSVVGTAWITTEEKYAKNKEQLTEFVKHDAEGLRPLLHRQGRLAGDGKGEAPRRRSVAAARGLRGLQGSGHVSAQRHAVAHAGDVRARTTRSSVTSASGRTS